MSLYNQFANRNVITWWMPQIWQFYPLLVPWCIRTFPRQQSIPLSPWIWLFVVQKHWPRGCHIESNIREIFFIYIRCLSTDFTVCTTSWGGTKEIIKKFANPWWFTMSRVDFFVGLPVDWTMHWQVLPLVSVSV